MTWPVQIQVTVIGAFLAVAGYVAKSAVDWSQQRRSERAKALAQLYGLQSLLKASSAIYNLQQELVKKLETLLSKNHPDECEDSLGHEETMTRCYGILDAKEKELHRIIRAYTQHSMRDVNLTILDWLRADELYKTSVVHTSREGQLAEELLALEMHLLLWNAKYESWIPEQPEHALVYMDDEKRHGVGFPKRREAVIEGKTVTMDGVDVEVARALEELRRK
jgi:hypothetical protein